MPTVLSRYALAPLLLAGLAACTTPPPTTSDNGWTQASTLADAQIEGPWQPKAIPGKAASLYTFARKDGRDTLQAQSERSASLLRRRLVVEPQHLGRLQFSWKVPALVPGADMAVRDADDSPVRILLAFDGDRGRFSAKNAMLNELSRALTGEEMPYATLMYVWCNACDTGTVIPNPRTDRVRKIPIESGPSRLNEWLSYERDIRQDFERAFGEAPSRLIGIAVMTDSDNTQSQAQAWYGPIRLLPGAAADTSPLSTTAR